MTLKISKKKIVFILIIIFILFYLNYPSKIIIDAYKTESITINLIESNSTKSIKHIRKITDYETMCKISDILDKISYKKISYLFDLNVIGDSGYSIEVVDKNGYTKIIKFYFDDTVRNQSNGRYKIKYGMSAIVYEELLAILKSN